MTTSDQDRAIEALQVELEGATLLVERRRPAADEVEAHHVWVSWDEGRFGVIVTTVGIFEAWTAGDESRRGAWFRAWNQKLTDRFFDEAAGL